MSDFQGASAPSVAFATRHYQGSFALANGRLFRLSLDLSAAGTLTGTVTDVVIGGEIPLRANRGLTVVLPKTLRACRPR